MVRGNEIIWEDYRHFYEFWIKIIRNFRSMQLFWDRFWLAIWKIVKNSSLDEVKIIYLYCLKKKLSKIKIKDRGRVNDKTNKNF